MSKRNLIALAVVASIAAPRAAWPCMNPVRIAGDKAVREIRRAEGLLRAGKYDALTFYKYEHRFRDERLERRAELITEIARMRSAEAGGKREEHSELVTFFREQLTGHPDDPILQARLAEALLLETGAASATEAQALIDDLVTRDLVPDTAAWVVVATVRARAGDADGSRDALARCKKIASRWRTSPCLVIAQ